MTIWENGSTTETTTTCYAIECCAFFNCVPHLCPRWNSLILSIVCLRILYSCSVCWIHYGMPGESLRVNNSRKCNNNVCSIFGHVQVQHSGTTRRYGRRRTKAQACKAVLAFATGLFRHSHQGILLCHWIVMHVVYGGSVYNQPCLRLGHEQYRRHLSITFV